MNAYIEGKIRKPLELLITYYDICSINKLSHRGTNWKNDAKMTNLHPLYRSLWLLHANLIRLTANFHLIVWTSSSWTRWASFPRDLIFFGRSFWYLKKIISINHPSSKSNLLKVRESQKNIFSCLHAP